MKSSRQFQVYRSRTFELSEYTTVKPVFESKDPKINPGVLLNTPRVENKKKHIQYKDNLEKTKKTKKTK